MFRTCTYADLFGVNLFQQFRKKILGKNQYPFHLSPPAIHYLTKEKYLNWHLLKGFADIKINHTRGVFKLTFNYL